MCNYFSRVAISIGDNIDSSRGVRQIDTTDSGVESLLHDRHPLAVIQGQRGGFGETDVEVSGSGIGPDLKSKLKTHLLTIVPPT